jgi:hypothetical protein
VIFGLLHVLLGVALLGAGPFAGGAAWLLAWPGASTLLVGLGYLGLGPRVFGKRAADGRLWPWPTRAAAALAAPPSVLGLMAWPYSALAWGIWQLRSRLRTRLRGERPHDEVARGIHVGRRPLGAAEVPPGLRVVVDLTSEMPRAAALASVERYLCVPVLDTAAPDDASLRALVDALAEEEGPILLHCAMGHGRAATVAAALLVRRGLARDVDEAVALMRAARPAVHLHPGQRAAVERLRGAAATLRGDDPSEDRPDRAPGAA